MKTIIKQPLVPYVVRQAETGLLEFTYRRHGGRIPAKVWLRLGRQIMQLDRAGYFFPLDAIDAYHDVILLLEKKASDMPQLNVASMETYLSAAAKKALFSYHVRKVKPLREDYRRLDDQIHAMEELDGVEDGMVLTAYQIAEALPGIPNAEERRSLAEATLHEVLDALDNEEVSRAFLAYVAADGNFVEAAHLARIGVNRFYTMWHNWLAAARRAAELITIKH